MRSWRSQRSLIAPLATPALFVLPLLMQKLSQGTLTCIKLGIPTKAVLAIGSSSGCQGQNVSGQVLSELLKKGLYMAII